MHIKNSTWTTGNEIHFINNLGLYGTGFKRFHERQHLLERYLAGALKRDDWGPINKDMVLAHVRSELDRIKKEKVAA